MSLLKSIQNIFARKPQENIKTPQKQSHKDDKIICRSLLFVPGNRPERFESAATSGADAIIIDLEDSVPAEHKEKARQAVQKYLSTVHNIKILIRVNPLDSDYILDDMLSLFNGKNLPDAIILPKAEGQNSIKRAVSLMGEKRIPILPIATETPAAIFEMGSYRKVRKHLFGLTWGAEDLPAAIGAQTSRNEDGSYTPPYEMARNMTLFAAYSANAQAIETVYPNIRDLDGLAEYAERAVRDGFTGMMALHPNQVMIINTAFSPNGEAVAYAREVIAAFAANPGAGVLELDGKMIDKPHLIQARKIIAAAAKDV